MLDEPVDGYSDVHTKEQSAHDAVPGAPDPGVAANTKPPLSPDERAKLESEIEADQARDSDRLHHKQS